MKNSPFLKTLFLFLVLILVLTACGPKSPTTPNQTSAPVGTEELALVEPTVTPTQELPKVLNICIAQEPESLYRYDGRNDLAKQSLFVALYGPNQGRTWLLENGDQFVETNQETIDLEDGMMVIAADGTVQILRQGLNIFPAGSSEVAAWASDAGYQLIRSTIIYKLKPGLLWSDGEPLTTKDVLYSYHLARRLALPSEQWALDRTANLEAIDEQTLRWTGIPGFRESDTLTFLWKPLPAHLLESLEDIALANADFAAITPPGWGAWRMTAWEKGTKLSLEKNPHFVGETDLSKTFDFLNFIIEPDLDQALVKFEAMECQVLDKSYHLEALEQSKLLDLAIRHQLVVEDYDLVEQLVFNTNPLSVEGAQSLLAEVGTRQAIHACLNPGTFLTKFLDQEWLEARVADGVDINQVEHFSDLPDAAAKLEEVGWTLQGATDGIRVAHGVPNVEDGTALRLTLLTGPSPQGVEIARLISETLAACGIAVNHQGLPVAELYAPGPNGQLFGRKFDMALLSWGKLPFPMCELYLSGQRPNADNYWIGTNIAGLNASGFDFKCMQGGQSSDEAMTSSVPALVLAPQLRAWLASTQLALPQIPRIEFLHEIAPKAP